MIAALASIEGDATIQADPRSFVDSFRRRIEAGLLSGRSQRRSRYVITQSGTDGLSFRAADWPTATNVGLNEVEIAASGPGRVRYAVRYRRWALSALAWGGAFGVVFMGFLLTFDLRGYLARQPPASLWLSVDQSLVFAWVMAVFWGFIWPWILIAMHRRPLRRLIERLIAEVDGAAVQHSAVAG